MPGEEALTRQLAALLPADAICGVATSMGYPYPGGTGPAQERERRQLWQGMRALLQGIQPAQRRSSACSNVFLAPEFYLDESPDRIAHTQNLLDAGFEPSGYALLQMLRRWPDTPAARATVTHLLAQGDLDRVVATQCSVVWEPMCQGFDTSLFAALLRMAASPASSGASSVQFSLGENPAWQAALNAHQADDQACAGGRQANNAMVAIFDTWVDLSHDDDDNSRPQAPVSLVQATRWALERCDAKAINRTIEIADPWTVMARRGATDLIRLAMTRGIDIDQGDSRNSLLRTFARGGDDKDFIALSEVSIHSVDGSPLQQGTAPDLSSFMASLAPPERPIANGGDIRILQWLLAHGASATAPIAGAAPRGIAALFDRDDIVHLLADAGAPPAVLTGNVREDWLRSRLADVADHQDDIPNPVDCDADSDDCGTSGFGTISRVDLDGDGRPEYILASGCGRFCVLDVLAYRDRRWRVVLSTTGYAEPLKTHHHGWRDIRVSVPDSPDAIWRYDGDVYQSDN